MAEQTLAALGVTTCADLIEQRGLLGALYSSVSTDYFMAVLPCPLCLCFA